MDRIEIVTALVRAMIAHHPMSPEERVGVASQYADLILEDDKQYKIKVTENSRMRSSW